MDDVVEKFVECVYVNGMDVFCIFDVMNDVCNFEKVVKVMIGVGVYV